MIRCVLEDLCPQRLALVGGLGGLLEEYGLPASGLACLIQARGGTAIDLPVVLAAPRGVDRPVGLAPVFS